MPKSHKLAHFWLKKEIFNFSLVVVLDILLLDIESVY